MRKEIKTELSLTQKDEEIVSNVQKEMMEDEISELSGIKEDDVNISTVYVFDDGKELEAKVYFRNGLNRNVAFEFVPLILLNHNDEVVARKTFDLRELGEVPSGGARPWKIQFDKGLVDLEKFNNQQCRVVFDQDIKTVNYASIEYEEIPREFRDYRSVFEKFLYELPRIPKGKLSISTFDIVVNESGKIIITLVIRNSANTNITLEELPIIIKDKENNIVASGRFTLKGFVVKSMKARICNLVMESNVEINNIVSFKDKWNVIFEDNQ